MARFSSYPRLVQAIYDGIRHLHIVYRTHGSYDGHDLINWLDANRNGELNEIYDLYSDCQDPEMTADQQIGKFLYSIRQIKIGNTISPRRITRQSGRSRNGTCKVSVWEISRRTALI